jgi:hypothetical protein
VHGRNSQVAFYYSNVNVSKEIKREKESERERKRGKKREYVCRAMKSKYKHVLPIKACFRPGAFSQLQNDQIQIRNLIYL